MFFNLLKDMWYVVKVRGIASVNSALLNWAEKFLLFWFLTSAPTLF